MQSEQIDQIATALSEFQRNLENPKRDRTVTVKHKDSNKSYKFSYTTFDKLTDYLRPKCAEHGLSFYQGPIETARGFAIETYVLHVSGQWIASVLPVPFAGGGMQALGSAVSYCRRYALAAILGVASEDDDDGRGAEARGARNITALKNSMRELDRAIRAATSQEELDALAEEYNEYIMGSKYGAPEVYNGYLLAREEAERKIRDAEVTGVPYEGSGTGVEAGEDMPSKGAPPEWAINVKKAIDGAVEERELNEIMEHYRNYLDHTRNAKTATFLKDRAAKKRAYLAQEPQ